MQKLYEPLTTPFKKNRGFLNYDRFDSIVKKYTQFFENSQTIYELLKANGYPIEEKLNGYYYKPYFTNYKEQTYVVVDIETNGSKPGYSQVIEIGAVKIKNLEIVDRLETFVYCAYVPDSITELTGIKSSDLKDAPSRKSALMMLKEFLEDSIFVAHNVNFDHSFLSASFARFGLGDIANIKLCTIDLARRTIKSQKYGLAGLCEVLNIDMQSHHRAYSDALCSWKIMKESLSNLPKYVKTTNDLIEFSTSTKKERKKKSSK